MKFGKNLFALLLALVMVVSLIPTAVFAEGEGEATTCTKQEGCANAPHAEDCPSYAAPTPDTCTKQEGCANAPHAEDCPSYAAPTPDTCTKQEGCANAPHAEDCPSYAAPTSDTCTKQEGCANAPHAEDCPSYTAPHTHSYSAWDWSAEEGTYFRTCADCETVEKQEAPAEIGQLMETVGAQLLEDMSNLRELVEAGVPTVLTQDAADYLIKGMIPDTGDNSAPVYDDVYTDYIVVEVANQTELDTAVAAATEKTLLKLASGTYTFHNNGSYANKKLVFKGTANVILDGTGLGNEVYGDELTFDNVTFNFPSTSHKGITHTNKVVFNNCTLTGTQTLYAPTVEFTGCTLNVTGDNYSVWTYGASNVTFSGCTFNTSGKAILVYTQDKINATITVNGCKFNSDGAVVGKAAVEVGKSEFSTETTYNIVINNSTTDGNFTANKSTSPLLGNKNDMDYKDLVGIVDGKEITRPDAVVEITSADGTKVGYPNLEDALADAKDGDTITLLENLDLSTWTSVDVRKKITLDGNGKTISSLTKPFINNASADLTIKKLTFTGANINVTSASGADNDTSAAVVVQWHNGGTLTMTGVSVTNSTVKGAGYAAALVGYVDSTAAYTSLNATVSGVTLTAGGTAGTFIGHSYGNGNLTGSVSGNTITSTSDSNTRPDKAGIVIGRTNQDTMTISVTVSSNNTLAPAGDVNPTRAVGSIPGGTVVIDGGSYPADPRLTADSNGATATISKLCKVTEENGTYIVTKAPAVAKIGNVEYADLAEAFKDLKTANGGTIELLSDVTLEDWESVDMTGTPFTFKGNGHTISGLTEPLFEYIGWNGKSVTIQELTISNPKVTSVSNNSGSNEAGALAAYVGTSANVTISDCHVTGGSVSGGFAGGLVGYAENGPLNIEDCSVTNVTVTGSSSAGAMVGFTNGAISVSGSVGGNTINSSSGSGWQGSVIGVLTSATGNTINVNEVSESKSSKPLHVIGGLLQDVTYTGGSYFTDPREDGDNPHGSATASPATGYTFVERTNGKFELQEFKDGNGNPVDPEEIKITKTITIQWDDKDNKRGIRPSKVIVNLYKDGKFDREIEMKANADGSWSRELSLTAYDTSAATPKEILYTVKQDAISGYTTSYSNDTFTITNKIKPRTAYSYSPDKLLQTGAEIQPIAMLTIAGVAALAASLWLVMKKKETYER